MKILQVNTERIFGGGENQVLLLLQGLRDRGIATTFSGPPGSPLLGRAREARIPVVEVPCRGDWDMFSAFLLARTVRRGGFDLLHLHTARAHTLGILAAWLFGCDQPLVVSRRVSFPPRRNVLSRKKYLHSQVRYIAVSEDIARILARSGVPAERIRVIHSGVDTGGAPGDFHLPGKTAGEVAIGTMGQLSPYKGQRYLLQAAPLILVRLPGARIYIAGTGALERELRLFAKELGLYERVAFTGFVEDSRAFLKALDVFVLPSIGGEGIPNVLLEALSAGTPVVATSVGGIAEIIRNQKEGRLVAPADPRALAEAVLDLIADPDRAREMAEKGKEKVAREFSHLKMIDATIAVYREVLEKVGT